MQDCPNLARCAFVKHCEENASSTSVKGFIHMYCKGPKQEECIRKQLCAKYNAQVVPVEMMPNGYPLPGSSKNDWSEEALNYRKLLAK